MELFEQGFERGEFVAFFLAGHLVQRQAQVMGHRRKQLQGLANVPAAAAQHLAIDGQLGQGSDLLLGQPLADEAG
jgi:hypothetical protein